MARDPRRRSSLISDYATQFLERRFSCSCSIGGYERYPRNQAPSGDSQQLDLGLVAGGRDAPDSWRDCGFDLAAQEAV